jgi:hypothetical protein
MEKRPNFQHIPIDQAKAEVAKAKEAKSKVSKREMRIVKKIGPAPYMAVCTNCSHQFRVTSGKEFTVEDATETLQKQFDAHDCNEDASQAAARIVREATGNH